MMLEVVDSPITRFAQEAERRRIARELHDTVVQSLTALLTDLEYFRARRLSNDAGTTPEVAAKLETWQELARDSLLSMRQALGRLRRHRDLDFDLESSVRTLLIELQNTGCTVRHECYGWPSTLPFEYTVNLYYIIREAITNICKHARANTVNVFMFSHEGHLHISIGDNGIGMASPPHTPSLMKEGYCQGLMGIRERAGLLGGNVSIESAPSKGTRIDVDVPLPWP